MGERAVSSQAKVSESAARKPRRVRNIRVPNIGLIGLIASCLILSIAISMVAPSGQILAGATVFGVLVATVSLNRGLPDLRRLAESALATKAAEEARRAADEARARAYELHVSQAHRENELHQARFLAVWRWMRKDARATGLTERHTPEELSRLNRAGWYGEWTGTCDPFEGNPAGKPHPQPPGQTENPTQAYRQYVDRLEVIYGKTAGSTFVAGDGPEVTARLNDLDDLGDV